MKHIKTGLKRGQFDVLAATRGAQAAKMTLRPGAASDDEPSNEHPHSEQWLFVVSGTGEAVVGKRRGALRRVPLSANSLLVVEKGESAPDQKYRPPIADHDQHLRSARL